MMLGRGTRDGVRILSEATHRRITSRLSPAHLPARGFGWDLRPPELSPARSRLLSESAYGHTGWTGQSLWIDPERDAYLDRLAQHYADGLLDDAGDSLAGAPLDWANRPATYKRYPDAPQFHVVPDQFRGGALQLVFGNTPYLHRVICDQPVAPLNELDSRLAFSDAAFPEYQNSFAVYINEHAVPRHHRCERRAQKRHNFADEIRGLRVAYKDRRFEPLGHLDALRLGLRAAAVYQGRYALSEKHLERSSAECGAERFQIRILRHSDDL